MLLQACKPEVWGCIRPGCVFLTLDLTLRYDERQAALARGALSLMQHLLKWCSCWREQSVLLQIEDSLAMSKVRTRNRCCCPAKRGFIHTYVQEHGRLCAEFCSSTFPSSRRRVHSNSSRGLGHYYTLWTRKVDSQHYVLVATVACVYNSSVCAALRRSAVCEAFGHEAQLKTEKMKRKKQTQCGVLCSLGRSRWRWTRCTAACGSSGPW